jgi:hypothetical protein
LGEAGEGGEGEVRGSGRERQIVGKDNTTYKTTTDLRCSYQKAVNFVVNATVHM